MWLVYIFVPIEAAILSPQHFYDQEIVLIMGVYVCV